MRRTTSLLIASVLLLMTIGIVILASTSSIRGAEQFEDPNYFLKRQGLWILISAVTGLFLLRFDYHWWQKLAGPLAVTSIVVLVLVLVVGPKIGGSRRWLPLGPVSVQPSEFAKFTLIVALAAWMTAAGRRSTRLLEGMLIPCALLGLFAGLMMLEPDFGTTMLTGAVGAAILFAGGTRFGYLLVAGTAGIAAFVLAVLRDPVRMGRVLAFLMPEKYPATAYHLAQSKIAFIRGGLFGVGLGNSIQKQFYLPEAHTDFILAIVGEELGFFATLGVVALFAIILVCGMIISFRAPDPFGRLLGFGLSMMIAIQAAINIGVVTGCLPTKGLALPFISYGGSSLLVSVVCVSVLANIAAHCDRTARDDHERAFRDSLHRV